MYDISSLRVNDLNDDHFLEGGGYTMQQRFVSTFRTNLGTKLCSTTAVVKPGNTIFI